VSSQRVLLIPAIALRWRFFYCDRTGILNRYFGMDQVLTDYRGKTIRFSEERIRHIEEHFEMKDFDVNYNIVFKQGFTAQKPVYCQC
jgi:hypothetical protein